MMSRFKVVLLVLVFVLAEGAASTTLPRGYAAGRMLAAADEPGELAELALDGRFDAATAAREIDVALAANDPDLAMSFVALARDRGVVLDRDLVARVEAADAASRSAASQALSFARGFVSGEPDSVAGFAGTAFGDLFVFGDVRDAAREGIRAARGEEVDKVVLGLSLAGIAITAGTYASLGAAAPARVGLSVLKAAEKTEQLGVRLARIVRLEKTENVVRVAGDLGRVEAKAGTRAAIEGLKLAEGPKDVERVARLAERERGKTRAVLKLLGRGAIVLTSAAFELASWVFWAIVNLLGLCAALKRATERATLHFIRRRKARQILE